MIVIKSLDLLKSLMKLQLKEFWSSELLYQIEELLIRDVWKESWMRPLKLKVLCFIDTNALEASNPPKVLFYTQDDELLTISKLLSASLNTSP